MATRAGDDGLRRCVLQGGLRAGLALGAFLGVLLLVVTLPPVPVALELPFVGLAVGVPVAVYGRTGVRVASATGRLVAGTVASALAGALSGALSGLALLGVNLLFLDTVSRQPDKILAFHASGLPTLQAYLLRNGLLNTGAGLVGGTLVGAVVGMSSVRVGRRWRAPATGRRLRRGGWPHERGARAATRPPTRMPTDPTLAGGPWAERLRRGLLGGLAAAALLVLATLLRYPPTTRTAPIDAGGSAGALLVLGLLGWWVWGQCTRALKAAGARAVWAGSAAGLVGALLWVAEISFNNFVDPAVATAVARGVVDDTAWGVIALLLGATALGCAYAEGRMAAGLRAGLWGGLVSGLGACLMALLLLQLWMPFVLRDPLNRQEWASRGATSGEPSMASYFAYQTLAGALLHLVVLGLLMGGLLGLVGGLLGRLLCAVHRTRL